MERHSRLIISELTENIGTSAKTLASDHVLEICPDEERKILPEDQAQIFHCIVI